jgi:hypothetical protein
MVTCPEHWNRPSVWTPDEISKCVRPKFKRVMGKSFLSLMVPGKMIKPMQVIEFLIKEFPIYLPASVSCIGEIESQLHLAFASTQF